MIVDIEDPAVEKAEKILSVGEKGFETWLRSKSVTECEAIVVTLKLRDSHAIQSYLDFVEKHQTIGVCSKCEWESGCVACDYKKALAYTIRHKSVPKFWATKTGQAWKREKEFKAKLPKTA